MVVVIGGSDAKHQKGLSQVGKSLQGTNQPFHLSHLTVRAFGML